MTDGASSVEAPVVPVPAGSPRPTFDRATAIPYAEVTRFLWGDEASGEVADWIYASTDRIHMLVFALPPGGRCLHSDAHRTVFGADVTYLVLEGCLALADPERGEVRVVEPGEAVLFRRDTWHHIFSHSPRAAPRTRVLCAASVDRYVAEVRPDASVADPNSLLGRRTAGALATREEATNAPPQAPGGLPMATRRRRTRWNRGQHRKPDRRDLESSRASEVRSRRTGATSASTSSKACSTCEPGVTILSGSSSIRATASTVPSAQPISTSTSTAASQRRFLGWPPSWRP